MKVGGGGAKQNASLEQGTQVSRATHRAETTSRHRHTVTLSGDTYQPLSLPWQAKKERRGGANCHKCTIWSSKLHDLSEQVRII